MSSKNNDEENIEVAKATTQPSSNEEQTDANANDASSGSTTIELNLRLDENGRTTHDPSLLSAPSSAAKPEESSNDNGDDCNGGPSSKRLKSDGDGDGEKAGESASTNSSSSLDYSSAAVMTNLASIDSNLESVMDELLFDCEITDCGLLPRTFWMPATGTNPRCLLEKLALQVFQHHVPDNHVYDPDTSGAEWWVQLRPSPEKTGRYSMLADKDDDDDMAKSGISFHWDKDEDLRLMCGGSMYIHPHISTVTYLTNLGAPTMVLSRRVDNFTGAHVEVPKESPTEGFVSWPKRGKHMSFDGRFLHAAPSDLMEEGCFEKQCSIPSMAEGGAEVDDKQKKRTLRRHRRVTFLVNVWLNYKPFNVDPFPATMVESLSKADAMGDLCLFSRNDGVQSCDEKKVSVATSGATMDEDDGEKHNVEVKKFTWPMGSSESENIEVMIPLELVRGQMDSGANIRLTWDDTIVLNGNNS